MYERVRVPEASAEVVESFVAIFAAASIGLYSIVTFERQLPNMIGNLV
jgi:hypothetical protein